MQNNNKREKDRKVLVVALLGVTALALTAAVSFGVTTFSAQAGGTGSYQTGTLLLSKTNSSGTCLSSSNSAGSITTNINAACAGSDLGSGTTNVPQVNQTSTVTLTNQGSINSASGLTLTTGACSAVAAPYGSSALNPLSSGSDTAGFCGKVDVTIFSTTTGKCVYPVAAGACPAPSSSNTLVTLASASPLALATSLAAGASVGLTITTQLDASATNADQGLAANATMTYTLGQ